MKMIKWLFGLCMMAIVIGISGVTVHAADVETNVSNFKWTENSDGTITIIKYTETDETVVIPSEIDNKKVKSIGEYAFNDCETIKCLIVSEGVICVDGSNAGNGACSGCKNLQSVFLPSTIKTIGANAFSNCSNLKEINLPEGLTSIGKRAFDDCGRLENIILPNSLTSVGEYAFWGCHSISKIVIPGNLKTIELGTFFNCTNLQEIEIKEGATKINGSFRHCNNLKKVIIPNSVNYMINEFIIGFESVNPIFPEGLVICANPNSYARTYANKMGIKFSCMNTHDWDSGVTTIEPTATSDGEKICTCTACGTKKTETVPKSGLPKKGNTVATPNSKDTYKVTKAATQNGTVEFSKVDKAKSSITIPDTITVDGITYKVTSISKNAFKNNKKLKKVTVGKNITTIGANAFYGCRNLKTITIKSTNLKTVSKNAFKGINSKAKIKVPKSKLTKYKKLLKGKGQKSTVKITK